MRSFELLQELMEILESETEYKETILLADAFHCDKKSTKKVIEEGRYYLLVIKDKNPTLKEEIELYVHNENIDKCAQTEKNGGRIEKCTAYTTT